MSAVQSATIPESAAVAALRTKVRTLFSYLQREEHGDYLGEAISQLQHALQCADLAVKANCDDHTVLACLLHDIGRFVPRTRTLAAKMSLPDSIAPDGSMALNVPHEIMGEQYLKFFGFSDKCAELVGAHVMAKRYLCATDNGYYESLSEASKQSLRIQGGTYTPEQVAEAQKDPYIKEKVQVRVFDDLAKDPNLPNIPQMDAYEDMAVRHIFNNHSVTVHGRSYSLLHDRPTVVVCIDGFDPEYLQQGLADGLLPNLQRFVDQGFSSVGKSCMPSFTNPNNMSIVSGAPPANHGISGNFVYNRQTGKSEMVLDNKFVRGTSVLAEASRKGVRVAMITAKDKLRQLLSHNMSDDAVCFSTERLDEFKVDNVDLTTWLGVSAKPNMYSAELSLMVLDAGVKLVQENAHERGLYYLTLSDYVQHRHAPGSSEANDFFVQIDKRLGQLADAGAIVGVTGDHGMSEKMADGKPNVVFLQDVLEAKYGPGSCKVVCPITDPFVRHHGALGSFVRVYLMGPEVNEVLTFIGSLPQVEYANLGARAAVELEMDPAIEGDIVVVSTKDAVLGARAVDHDMTQLGGKLRSHGGFSEQDVPVLVSVPCEGAASPLHNYDIFDLVLNRISA